MIRKFLTPRNDIAFKRIFGREKNQDILIAMLNAVLENQLSKPIKTIHFLPTYQDPDVSGKKQSIVDVLCRDEDGCQYIIEMQVAQRNGFQERAQYYASKAFIQQMKAGEAYQDLKEVIFLAFCDFPIFPHKKDYKSEHIILDKKTHERDLDKFSFTFVDLVKFDKQNKKSMADLSLEEKFYHFLRRTEDITQDDLQALVGHDEVIKRAYDELVRHHWTEEELLRYEKEEKDSRDHNAALDYKNDQAVEKGKKEGRKEGQKEGLEKGRQQGRKEGLQEGEKAGIQKVAKQMLAEGFDDKIIARITKLPTQAIQALA